MEQLPTVTPLRRVLVAGATGFVGRALCARLQAMGVGVIALSRDPGRAVRLLGPQVEVLRDAADIDDAVQLDAIVNLAGEPIAGGLWTEARRQRIVQSRVHATTNLCTLIRRLPQRPPVLVNASAVGYYGEGGDSEFDENSPPGNGFLSEICQRWEAAAIAAEAPGTRVVRLRIGLVMGPGGGLLQPLALGTRCGFGAVMGQGQQWMSWIHLDDLLDLILFAIRNPACTGALDATAPEPVRQRDFAACLARVLERPLWLRMPAGMLRALSGPMSELFLISQRVLPHRTCACGFAFRHPRLEPALRAIL